LRHHHGPGHGRLYFTRDIDASPNPLMGPTLTDTVTCANRRRQYSVQGETK